MLNQTHVPLASYPPGTEIIIGRSSLTDPKLKSQAAFSRILDAPPASSPPKSVFSFKFKETNKKTETPICFFYYAEQRRTYTKVRYLLLFPAF